MSGCGTREGHSKSRVGLAQPWKQMLGSLSKALGPGHALRARPDAPIRNEPNGNVANPAVRWCGQHHRHGQATSSTTQDPAAAIVVRQAVSSGVLLLELDPLGALGLALKNTKLLEELVPLVVARVPGAGLAAHACP